MDEILETVENTQTEETEFKIATISAITEDGIKLQFDGATATEKEYKCNPSVLFTVGDRVVITKDSGTVIVDHPIGKPMEDYHPIADGGITGQVLTKSSDADYDADWDDIDINNLLPSGTVGEYLKKTASGCEWDSVTAETNQLVSGSTKLTLNATSLTPNSNGNVSLGSSLYRYDDLYTSGDVSLGNNTYSSKLGFFGTNPISKVTNITTSSTLAQVIQALKNYGLL